MTSRQANAPGLLTDDFGRTRLWVLLLSTFLIVWCLAIYAYIVLTAPSFQELFAGFGAELPMLTALVLDYSRLAVVPALVSLAPLVLIWRHRTSEAHSKARDLTLVVVAFTVSIVLGSIAVYGLYLPIFKMGAVVS